MPTEKLKSIELHRTRTSYVVQGVYVMRGEILMAGQTPPEPRRRTLFASRCEFEAKSEAQKMAQASGLRVLDMMGVGCE